MMPGPSRPLPADAVGSVATNTSPAFTFSNFCTTPEGHLISTSFALVSRSRPTMSRLSLAERYPAAVVTV